MNAIVLNVMSSYTQTMEQGAVVFNHLVLSGVLHTAAFKGIAIKNGDPVLLLDDDYMNSHTFPAMHEVVIGKGDYRKGKSTQKFQVQVVDNIKFDISCMVGVSRANAIAQLSKLYASDTTNRILFSNAKQFVYELFHGTHLVENGSLRILSEWKGDTVNAMDYLGEAKIDVAHFIYLSNHQASRILTHIRNLLNDIVGENSPTKFKRFITNKGYRASVLSMENRAIADLYSNNHVHLVEWASESEIYFDSLGNVLEETIKAPEGR